jgi:hypothetical protein
MHTYVIHFTLLAFCKPNMFRTSKGHLHGVRLIYFHSQINKMYTRCKIHVKFSLSSSVTLLNKLSLTSCTYFVDLAVKMYQSYSL